MGKKNYYDNGDYDPYAERQVDKPTTDFETFMHLLKGSLGSGLMAISFAFRMSGLATGVFLTLFTGFLCTYCVNLLVKVAHSLQYRNKVPKYSYNETFQEALLVGPDFCKKFSWWGSFLVDIFLVIDLYGCCVIYTVTAAKNFQQIFGPVIDLDARVYMVIISPILIGLGCVRYLKYLAPLSAFANVLMLITLCIVYYYSFEEVHSPTKVVQFTRIQGLPIFFGVCIFSLEGIGVVMPLENNMKTPTHFLGCPGVLVTGMSIVVALYAFTGFFGYLRFGDASEGSLTLNLPTGDWHSICAKVCISIAIIITYGLQYYVPYEITWKTLIKIERFKKHPLLYEYLTRIIVVIITVLIAIAVPNIGGFIGLVGALCLSFLGLIFPCIAECCIYYDSTGMGKCYWILFKNVAIMIFGVIGCISGVTSSIDEIIDNLKETS